MRRLSGSDGRVPCLWTRGDRTRDHPRTSRVRAVLLGPVRGASRLSDGSVIVRPRTLRHDRDQAPPWGTRWERPGSDDRAPSRSQVCAECRIPRGSASVVRTTRAGTDAADTVRRTASLMCTTEIDDSGRITTSTAGRRSAPATRIGMTAASVTPGDSRMASSTREGSTRTPPTFTIRSLRPRITGSPAAPTRPWWLLTGSSARFWCAPTSPRPQSHERHASRRSTWGRMVLTEGADSRERQEVIYQIRY